MEPVIIAASVQGASHVRHGIEKQDSYRIVDYMHDNGRNGAYSRTLPGDVHIAAVADGHGSASCPYSKTGSKTAVDVFCDMMADLAETYREDMPGLFDALRREGETAKLSGHIVREWEKRILGVHAMGRREMPRDADGGIDEEAVWKQYGTTLLGVLVSGSLMFALQLGDGDITYADMESASPVVLGDKLLGVETHSISKPDSWKKVHTAVVDLEHVHADAFMYALSTDGWMNSHASGAEFARTCREYVRILREHGGEAVEQNLPAWLTETSAMGCGDDITVVIFYYDKKGDGSAHGNEGATDSYAG